MANANLVSLLTERFWGCLKSRATVPSLEAESDTSQSFSESLRNFPLPWLQYKASQDSSKGGAVEKGGSDLYAAIY